MNPEVQKFWNDFLVVDSSIPNDTPFQVWFFGDTVAMADSLAGLVILGRKIATASLAAVNKIKPEVAPNPEGYSVITDFQGVPMCVIQTAEIRHLPFIEVDAQFALDEGGGDLTLEYWRGAHWRYFSREAAELGIDFDEHSIICCERFRLLYSG